MVTEVAGMLASRTDPAASFPATSVEPTMPEYIKLIPHAQNTELRLQLGQQQTSFTLPPDRPIPQKTLTKIEAWLLSQGNKAGAAQILEQVQHLALSTAPSIKLPPSRAHSLIVCDYSTQGNISVWACVISTGREQVMCCGPVPKGEQGERYAVLRSHHYLQRLDCTGTILCDEKNTTERLRLWYPVGHIDRSDSRHKPAHQLAHDFALLLTGKPVTGVVAELKALTSQFWPQYGQTDFIRFSNHGWKIAGG